LLVSSTLLWIHSLSASDMSTNSAIHIIYYSNIPTRQPAIWENKRLRKSRTTQILNPNS
jgi:hypothetical protein